MKTVTLEKERLSFHPFTHEDRDLVRIYFKSFPCFLTSEDNSSFNPARCSLIVPKHFLMFSDDPKEVILSFPTTNKDNEPWKLNFSKQVGHKDASGKFVIDSSEKHVVDALAFVSALKNAEQAFDEMVSEVDPSNIVSPSLDALVSSYSTEEIDF